MSAPVIAWLTDFGTRDHYVGTMKGVVLTIAPDAALVDITHELEPQDVLGGALELDAAYRHFPAGTIFVAVVDPGVGTSRRAIAAQADGYFFVGPDNGVLTLPLRVKGAAVVELAGERYARPQVSPTFEGRDRFAPAAAWLARGTALGEFGPAVSSWHQLTIPAPQVSPEEIVGDVLRIDRFGNAITNVPRDLVEPWLAGAIPVIVAGEARIEGLVTTYAHGGAGPCALYSSTNHLEVAVAGQSAARALGLSRGTTVTMRRLNR